MATPTPPWLRAELIAAPETTPGAQLMIPADGVEFHDDQLVFHHQGDIVYVAPQGQLRSITWFARQPNPETARRKAQWPNHGTRWTDEERADLHRHLRTGHTWKTISHAHGRSRTGCQQEAIKQGWLNPDTLLPTPALLNGPDNYVPAEPQSSPETNLNAPKTNADTTAGANTTPAPEPMLMPALAPVPVPAPPPAPAPALAPVAVMPVPAPSATHATASRDPNASTSPDTGSNSTANPAATTSPDTGSHSTTNPAATTSPDTGPQASANRATTTSPGPGPGPGAASPLAFNNSPAKPEIGPSAATPQSATAYASPAQAVPIARQAPPPSSTTEVTPPPPPRTLDQATPTSPPAPPPPEQASINARASDLLTPDIAMPTPSPDRPRIPPRIPRQRANPANGPHPTPTADADPEKDSDSDSGPTTSGPGPGSRFLSRAQSSLARATLGAYMTPPRGPSEAASGAT